MLGGHQRLKGVLVAVGAGLLGSALVKTTESSWWLAYHANLSNVLQISMYIYGHLFYQPVWVVVVITRLMLLKRAKYY